MKFKRVVWVGIKVFVFATNYRDLKIQDFLWQFQVCALRIMRLNELIVLIIEIADQDPKFAYKDGEDDSADYDA